MMRLSLTLCSVLVLAGSAAQRGPAVKVSYEPVAAEHRGHLSVDACTLDGRLARKPLSIVPSPAGVWAATIEETDSVVVSSDREEACETLRGPQQTVRGVRFHGFRTLTVSWVNDRLVSFSMTSATSRVWARWTSKTGRGSTRRPRSTTPVSG